MAAKTIAELFAYSDGTTCDETRELLDTYYPGWTPDTSVDLYEYLEFHRTEGKEVFALVSVFKAFDSDQAISFIAWAKANILTSGQPLSTKHQEQMALIEANSPSEVDMCRWLRKMLLEHGTTDGQILTKCEELLGIIP